MAPPCPELSLTELIRLSPRERMEYMKSIDNATAQDHIKMAAVYPSGDRRELAQDQALIDNAKDAVLGSPGITPRRTRRDTRLDSYFYPAPYLGTEEEDNIC